MTPIEIRIVGSLPTDWLNIGFSASAVLVGALIGAGISWWVARQSARETRDAATAARRANEEAATLRAVVTFMELMNSIAGYHLGNERTIASGTKAHNRRVETWIVMLPQVGRPQEIRIQPDDLIAFTRSREFEFVTNRVSCPRISPNFTISLSRQSIQPNDTIQSRSLCIERQPDRSGRSDENLPSVA